MTTPTLWPRTFRSVHKFSGESTFVQQSSFTQSKQPVFQINGDMVLANHFQVEIEFFHSMTRTNIVEPFHRQNALRREFIGIWKKFLSFHSPFSCFVLASVCLTSMHFIITRLIKQLKSCRCASVYMLRIAESCGQSTSHSRILSRYSS